MLSVIIFGFVLGAVDYLFGMFQTGAAMTLENVTQILPMTTLYHSLPTAGGRSIPVKVINFRHPDRDPLEGSASDNVELPSSLRIPRGFRDDFDMQPKVNSRRLQLENRFEISVPIVPQNQENSKWTPGELIVSEITRRQMKQIDQSRFGPLKAITFVPSVRSAILVFEKRYNPEKLSIALKYLYGIDSEPNGIITSV